MDTSYSFHEPGGGTSYAWENDHIFVKASGVDTGGAYTVVEDNLKPTFALGLHLHRHHAETFYILDGSVEFYVGGDWISAPAGSCLHVPPNVPHAAKTTPGCPSARMLMIFQPSGFELFLEEIGRMTEDDFRNEAHMSALQDKYDIIQLGPVPDDTRANG